MKLRKLRITPTYFVKIFANINLFTSLLIFSISKTDAKAQMERMFKILCSQENDIIRPRTITHFGRDLTFQRTCGQVLDSTFEELCDRVRISMLNLYQSK